MIGVSIKDGENILFANKKVSMERKRRVNLPFQRDFIVRILPPNFQEASRRLSSVIVAVSSIILKKGKMSHRIEGKQCSWVEKNEEDWDKYFMDKTNSNALAFVNSDKDWIIDFGYGHLLTRDVLMFIILCPYKSNS